MSKLLPIPNSDPRTNLKGVGNHALAGCYILDSSCAEDGFIVGEAKPGFVVMRRFDDFDVYPELEIVEIEEIRKWLARGTCSLYDNFADFRRAELREIERNEAQFAKKVSA